MILIRIVLVFVIFCQRNAYSEHKKLIPKCVNSCSNNKPQSTNCFCDSKCSLIYNDCCLDAPYRSFRVNTKRYHNIQCSFVIGENKDFWMVSTCKDSWSGHNAIKNKCTSDRYHAGESSDVSELVPVTSPKEEVTYKNYYCGICNGENPENLIEWQVKALCANRDVKPIDVSQNLTYVEDWLQWGVWKTDIKGNLKFNECHLLFQRPFNVTSGIRQCISNMISTCPSSWRNIAIRRRCKSYLDPIRWSEGPVYKNIDCAVCHNITKPGYHCVYDSLENLSDVVLNLAMPVDMSAMGQWF